MTFLGTILNWGLYYQDNSYLNMAKYMVTFRAKDISRHTYKVINGRIPYYVLSNYMLGRSVGDLGRHTVPLYQGLC